MVSRVKVTWQQRKHFRMRVGQAGKLIKNCDSLCIFLVKIKFQRVAIYMSKGLEEKFVNEKMQNPTGNQRSINCISNGIFFLLIKLAKKKKMKRNKQPSLPLT